jgi:hypothetical protein
MLVRTFRLLAVGAFALGFALSAQGAPAMFDASFIFHAWSNDISSGTTSPYVANAWTAAPLGYDCQHAEPYSTNGAPNSRYCTPTKIMKGHPATGAWSRTHITTGRPQKITVQQSDFGVQLITNTSKYAPPYSGTTPQCCRGFIITFPPYLQSWTYATFINAAGSFFAGGGAVIAGPGASGMGTTAYNNKTGMQGSGTWRIRAGKNQFGGAMGLLGKYGAQGAYTVTGMTGTFRGTSDWVMVQPIGRPLSNTQIGTGTMGTAIWQNPYSHTNRWYQTTPKGKVNISTILAVGSGTLWTTGQVGAFAKTGAYYTSQWRTGYDNRDSQGFGNIQLVTPTLTHWLSPGWNTHTAQIGMLTLSVPEPGAVLLLAAGGGVLGLLYWTSRRV